MNSPIDISNVVLKTERLVLRPWRLSDLDDFYEYASVDGVGEMAGWPHHKSKDDSLVILKRFIENKRTFAIEYNNKAIGSLGIEEYDEDKLPELKDLKAREIGYVLAKPYWGLGLMPEAVKRVIDYLFTELKLDVLVCGHYQFNNQSRRVQEKCGFKHYKYSDDLSNIVYEKIDGWESLLFNKSYETNDPSIILRMNVDKIHTTTLGYERIERVLNYNDNIDYIKNAISNYKSTIIKNGKNYYIEYDNVIICVNSKSYTVITVKRKK